MSKNAGKPMLGKTGINHPNSKQITQLDLNGNIIKYWGSGREIQRTCGYDSTTIINCCKKKKRYKTAYGYKWEYTKNEAA